MFATTIFYAALYEVIICFGNMFTEWAKGTENRNWTRNWIGIEIGSKTLIMNMLISLFSLLLFTFELHCVVVKWVHL